MSPPIPSDSGVPATTEMEDAAAGGGDGAVTMPPPAPTCPVCMEPWTCNGDHRICCIPCGHVYGRSCLVKWLHRCGDDTAKCPQCGEQFEDKLIINLYAPGNLWDGCCRLEERHDPASSSYARRPQHGVSRFFSSMWQMCKNTNDVAHQSLALNQETRRRQNEFMAARNVPVPPPGPELEPLHAPNWEMPPISDEMFQNFDPSLYTFGGPPPRPARVAADDDADEDEGDEDEEEDDDGEGSYSPGHEFY
ncbi:uncharacterized protein [Lolium perenne]|uniref:uncharacterized protein n=1 Tax=Lolium perenne TaxID=4522 RepID=UPI0021F65B3A|nr:uncharacterized protein LOC127312806 isoform X3 [Lolium perenne]